MKEDIGPDPDGQSNSMGSAEEPVESQELLNIEIANMAIDSVIVVNKDYCSHAYDGFDAKKFITQLQKHFTIQRKSK